MPMRILSKKLHGNDIDGHFWEKVITESDPARIRIQYPLFHGFSLFHLRSSSLWAVTLLR
uniref:Uncharacterized protein n=1 Tax=Romanomermis culicivorax TaxID=13658 RepID=A0A915J942_ROMCU